MLGGASSSLSGNIFGVYICFSGVVDDFRKTMWILDSETVKSQSASRLAFCVGGLRGSGSFVPSKIVVRGAERSIPEVYPLSTDGAITHLVKYVVIGAIFCSVEEVYVFGQCAPDRHIISFLFSNIV